LLNVFSSLPYHSLSDRHVHCVFWSSRLLAVTLERSPIKQELKEVAAAAAAAAAAVAVVVVVSVCLSVCLSFLLAFLTRKIGHNNKLFTHDIASCKMS